MGLAILDIVVICSDEKVKLIRVISYDENMEI
jgi:hypothetical protein